MSVDNFLIIRHELFNALDIKNPEACECGENQTADHILWNYPQREEFRDHVLAIYQRKEDREKELMETEEEQR